MTGSDHDHPHAPIVQPAPGYYEVMEIAVRELLMERGLIGAHEIRRQIEVLDLRTPALGAWVVARPTAENAEAAVQHRRKRRREGELVVFTSMALLVRALSP